MKNFTYLLMMLGLVFVVACSEEEEEPTMGGSGETETRIWTGPDITFSKATDTDHNDETNQDRITGNVWITRSTAGGEIFNIVNESASNKDVSPSGTSWAVGDIADANNLTFTSFRSAVGSPQRVVGIPLVMRLDQDNIILSLTFTSWDANKGGGFAYTRSTAP